VCHRLALVDFECPLQCFEQPSWLTRCSCLALKFALRSVLVSLVWTLHHLSLPHYLALHSFNRLQRELHL
jgi:hypothetical protein